MEGAVHALKEKKTITIKNRTTVNNKIKFDRIMDFFLSLSIGKNRGAH